MIKSVSDQHYVFKFNKVNSHRVLELCFDPNAILIAIRKKISRIFITSSNVTTSLKSFHV
jgi:hypothetical protein